MTPPALEFANVRVLRGGRPVLSLEPLAIESGSIVTVEGGNGAGKSTLLLASAGLIPLAEGTIHLFGQPYHLGAAPAPRDQRRRTGLVLQDPWLPEGTVGQAVQLGLRLRGVPGPVRSERLNSTIQQLELQDLQQRQCHSLSGGERRQVALACVWALDPDILLLDEVTSGLDDTRCQHFERVLLPKALARGKTLLVSTHDPELASRLGARRIVLWDGRVRE